jgi:hypothetical protein
VLDPEEITRAYEAAIAYHDRVETDPNADAAGMLEESLSAVRSILSRS